MIRKILLFSLILVLLTVPAYAGDVDSGIGNGTFADLDIEMNNATGKTVQLNGNYTYDSSADAALNDGVVIARNVTVKGHNSCIDGNNAARGLKIESNCNVVLESLTFKNCYSENGGGAILLNSNSNLTIINCVFEANKVYNSNGGALCSHSGTNIEIHNCMFSNNTSIRESDLEWEQFKRGMGSAICVGIDSNLRLYDSVFEKNNAYLSTILVISYDDVLYKLSTLLVSNCTFENNTSKRSGVIYLDELGKGEILDSVFRKNNILETSGTVILDASIYARIKNCLFEENSAIKGGAINLKKFEDKVSNVYITGCNFTGNFASVSGGAIFSNCGNLHIDNSTFIQNLAGNHGGAVYAYEGMISVRDCEFNGNMAEYGGAVSANSIEIHFENAAFIQNTAYEKGGAVYSKIENVDASNCEYIDNRASKGSNVYGVFDAKIKTLSSYFGGVELEIKLASQWKMPLSQSIKVKFKGKRTYTTKWLKTNQNGILKIKVPLKLKIGKYKITIIIDNGFCYSSKTIKVKKAPCRAHAKKLTTPYKSGKIFKIKIKNKKTKKPVSKARITFKIGKGKAFTKTTNRKGLVTFNTNKLNGGKHIVKIYSKDRNIRLSASKKVIKIKKAKAKISYPKKVKNHHMLKVTIKNKATGKPIKKTKFEVKVDNGKKSKSLKVKTDKKGQLKLKLKKGKNKISIKLKNRNYSISKKLKVKQR